MPKSRADKAGREADACPRQQARRPDWMRQLNHNGAMSGAAYTGDGAKTLARIAQ